MKTIRKKTTGYKVENLKEDIIQEALDNLPEGSSGGEGGSKEKSVSIELVSSELTKTALDNGAKYTIPDEKAAVFNELNNITAMIISISSSIDVGGLPTTVDIFYSFTPSTAKQIMTGGLDSKLIFNVGLSGGFDANPVNVTNGIIAFEVRYVLGGSFIAITSLTNNTSANGIINNIDGTTSQGATMIITFKYKE